jgi:cytochrome P450
MVRLPTSRIVKVVPNTQEGDMTTTEPPTASRRDSIAGLCVQLGVPPKDWHLFRRWASESSNSKALDELHAYVDVMIADRCRKPGTDLMSELIQSGIEGEELTVDDMRAIVAAQVFRAG